MMLWDPVTAKMKESETALFIDERQDMHADIRDWEIDDDTVGDEWWDVNANWVVHSHDD